MGGYGGRRVAAHGPRWRTGCTCFIVRANHVAAEGRRLGPGMNSPATVRMSHSAPPMPNTGFNLWPRRSAPGAYRRPRGPAADASSWRCSASPPSPTVPPRWPAPRPSTLAQLAQLHTVSGLIGFAAATSAMLLIGTAAELRTRVFRLVSIGCGLGVASPRTHRHPAPAHR